LLQCKAGENQEAKDLAMWRWDGMCKVPECKLEQLFVEESEQQQFEE
jgi:hypothetical protein